ncbi:MAG: DUF5702 domain-containing protein [Lachnospiraceae bacterium]|nr:DUF5702 domain-containing protein [Lachnospiraceae bacterium]
MGRLSKRRGAISVFLLLIFMVSYVFMGLLVDAARYRMAQAYVESALDNASNSLLSSYNQLVFDLYGLFTMDVSAEDEDKLEEQIKEKYEKYLSEALGIAKVDAKKYSTKIAELIFSEEKGPVLDASGLYDFDIRELNAGTEITLADTANVNNQIVEYMKFRAPVQLIGEVDGFVKKLNEILTIKDAIEIAVEKNNISEKHENPPGEQSLADQAAGILKDVREFEKKMYNYSVGPTDALPAAGTTVTKSGITKPYYMYTYITNFDTEFKNAHTTYENALKSAEENYLADITSALGSLKGNISKDKAPEITLSGSYKKDDKEYTKNFTEVNTWIISDDELKALAGEVKSAAGARTTGSDFYNSFLRECNDSESARGNAIENAKAAYKGSVYNAKYSLINYVLWTEDNADTLYLEAAALKARTEHTFQLYENYVNEMEGKLKKAESGEHYDIYESQYVPTIQLAKANGGALLKNLDILISSESYLKNIAPDGKQRLSGWLEDKIDGIIGNAELPKYTGAMLASQVHDNYAECVPLNELYLQSFPSKSLYEDTQRALCVIFSHTMDTTEEISKKDDKTEEAKKIAEEDISETGKSELKKPEGLSAVDNELVRKHPDWTNVNYSYTPSSSSGMEVELETGKIKEGFMTKVLNLGKSMVEGLGNLLEAGRDNLYMDAYILSTFPNYKAWKDWDGGKNESDLKCLNAPYEGGGISYNASYAEVEYIITGKAGTDKEGFGENSVESMRFRLFGTRMLFNTLSILLDGSKMLQAQSMCVWAGPFAPLVTFVLLAAWAALESSLDVMVLMGDAPFETTDSTEGIPIYKRGSDWYISTEGLVKNVAEGAVNALASKITDEATEMIGGLEAKANEMIYDAYTSTKTTVDGIYDEIHVKEAQDVVAWGKELTDNLKKTGAIDSGSINTLEQSLKSAGDAFQEIETVKSSIDTGLMNAKEQAVVAVSRTSKKAVECVKNSVNSLSSTAKEGIKKNVAKILPSGKEYEKPGSSVRMTYNDYLFFYLFIMNSTEKIQRVQSLIQVNMRVGGHEDFSMEYSPVSIWSDLECGMRYLFLSNGIVPDSMKRDGRLRFKVISAQSY